jgi:hypothetical protein
MADRKSELVRDEDTGWAELSSLVAKLSEPDLLRPGYSNEWTVKDLLGHLACWWAETGAELERIRNGTYDATKIDLDAKNAQFFDAMKDLDLHTIRAELAASRNKALEELWRLAELTPAAEEWFAESGALHYEAHLPELRRFVGSEDG